MTRTMQDSVNPRALLPGADLYAGYVDGRYANVAAIRARFPHTRVVSITVLGGHTEADVADVERGDLTPESGAQWALWRHRGGHHPTLYCNTSTRPAVQAACARLGLALHRDYEVWEAHYDNVVSLPAGAVAKQYRDHGPRAENIDMSVVAAYWRGVDPAPARFVYRRVLRRGMVGLDVVALKRRLRALGYHAPFMGVGPYFSRGLYASVRSFQRDHHLGVDGVVGPITAGQINR